MTRVKKYFFMSSINRIAHSYVHDNGYNGIEVIVSGFSDVAFTPLT